MTFARIWRFLAGHGIVGGKLRLPRHLHSTGEAQVSLAEARTGDILFYRDPQLRPMVLLPGGQVLGVVRDRIKIAERAHANSCHVERWFTPLHWVARPNSPNTWLQRTLWEARERGVGIEPMFRREG